VRFTITLKDPDGVSNAVKGAAQESLPEGLDEEEKEALLEMRIEKINDFLGTWVFCGEYVSISFDTEQGTATLVANGF
jgi:hypothetical protein